MADTTDILIIGGGVQAASLAFHLAQRGASVTVLEKQHVAAGATGRSSGLVRMHYDTEVNSRLAWESFQYFRDWKERVGGECGFTRTGFIQIVPIEQEAALRANVLMHQRIGIPALVVTAEDVKRLAPSFTTGDFKVAAYEPEVGFRHAQRYGQRPDGSRAPAWRPACPGLRCDRDHHCRGQGHRRADQPGGIFRSGYSQRRWRLGGSG